MTNSLIARLRPVALLQLIGLSVAALGIGLTP